MGRQDDGKLHHHSFGIKGSITFANDELVLARAIPFRDAGRLADPGVPLEAFPGD